MSEQPRVCMISPFYNRAHGVRNTLESLCAQTYQNVEFLVWDDCSKDDTWRELQRVSDEIGDPRLRIFRNSTNLGLSAGLNKAISMTDAKYVAVIGSGDGCDPDRVRLQVEALEADPAAVLCTAGAMTTDIRTGVVFRDTSFHGEVVRSSDMTDRCAVPHGAVMYRRSDVLALGGYAEALKWCADWDLFNRLLRMGHGIYIQKILSFRIAQEDGVSFHPQKAFEQLACKQLVIKLATLSETDRTNLLEKVKLHGPISVVAGENGNFGRDLARRNIKLFLMGRREEALEMSRLAKSQQIAYPGAYNLFLIGARLLTSVSKSNYRMIAFARRFIK